MVAISIRILKNGLLDVSMDYHQTNSVTINYLLSDTRYLVDIIRIIMEGTLQNILVVEITQMVIEGRNILVYEKTRNTAYNYQYTNLKLKDRVGPIYNFIRQSSD